jgi:hypothetical protein
MLQSLLDSRFFSESLIIQTPQYITENVTHVVCPLERRTLKTLAAGLSERWIVPELWVRESVRAGHWVDEAEIGGFMGGPSPFVGKVGGASPAPPFFFFLSIFSFF